MLTSDVARSRSFYEYVLRGRELLLGKTKNRETFEQSIKLFMRAMELDPNHPKAYAALSMAYNLDYQNRWSDDPDSSLPLAKRCAEQAIEKDPNEPFARLVASWAAIFGSAVRLPEQTAADWLR